jgi:uncharacterized protein YecT (DUF1311 family)
MHMALVLSLFMAVHPCDSPRKPDLLKCAEQQRIAAQADLDRYFGDALRMLDDAPRAAAALQKAQTAWLAFVDADCKAAYEASGQGEREIQAAFCRASAIRERADALRDRYFPDGEP